MLMAHTVRNPLRRQRAGRDVRVPDGGRGDAQAQQCRHERAVLDNESHEA